MLYIETKVNGYPVQAFVDSGAQSTIISKECAERCNIMHLLDTRFAGIAVGVGSSKILGRVHLADLQLIQPDGKIHSLQCSFTVLEDNKVDLLFGLDNLKRHQCCIDLVDWRLHFHKSEFSVPFLADGEIKANKMEQMKDLQM
jgi:DNA damage-inducible protein 1